MGDKIDMALFTFTLVNGASCPTIEDAAEILNVSVSDIYKPHGVVNINPEKNIYSVMAREDKVKAAYSDADKYFGPWSSPEIDTSE